MKRTGIILAAVLAMAGCDRSPSPSPIAFAAPHATEASGPTVYVTRTGKKYHRSTCRYVYDATKGLPLEDAVREYQPCKVCKPPR